MKRAFARFAVLLCLVAAPVTAQVSENYERGLHAGKEYNFGGIDHINLFNGNLSVMVPFGKVVVGGGLAYDLTLAYNSNAWSFSEVPVTRTSSYGTYWTHVAWEFPNSSSNAGLGWTLSLGRLVNDGDPAYESPDGSDHHLNWTGTADVTMTGPSSVGRTIRSKVATA